MAVYLHALSQHRRDIESPQIIYLVGLPLIIITFAACCILIVLTAGFSARDKSMSSWLSARNGDELYEGWLISSIPMHTICMTSSHQHHRAWNIWERQLREKFKWQCKLTSATDKSFSECSIAKSRCQIKWQRWECIPIGWHVCSKRVS